MALRSLLTIVVVLMAAARVWAAVSDAPRSATVSLERTVHFLGPDGSEEVAPAGTYHVEVAGASSLRLVPSGRKKGVLVQALATSHTEKLATPVALSIPVNEGEHHLVVLLPGGTGFDAVGSPTGIRPRGSAAVPLTQAQVHNLLAQQAQQKTTSPGSVAGPLGVPTKPTLRRIPADVVIPPDVQALQRISTPPTQQKMIGTAREGSLEKLRRLSPTNALPPATSKPPELQRLEKMATLLNLAPKPRPTVNGLLETLRNLPGGREAIEEAKRRGARISMKSQQPGSSPFARLNPLGITEAEAEQDFTVTLTPEKPGDSLLQFVGVWLWVPNRPILDSTILTSGNLSSRAIFRVTVPRDGFYVVNIETSSAGVKASLHTGGGVVQTWDYQGRGGGISYPAILELAAGPHWFRWILEAGTAEFRKATVDSL